MVMERKTETRIGISESSRKKVDSTNSPLFLVDVNKLDKAQAKTLFWLLSLAGAAGVAIPLIDLLVN